MRKVLAMFFSVLLLTGSLAYAKASKADVDKGQKIYVKHLKEAFGDMKAADFTKTKNSFEWRGYFSNNGKKFAEEFSKTYPKAAEYLKSKDFQEHAKYLQAFAMSFSKDSGALPSCK